MTTFLLDADVLVYSAVESEYREPCLEILTAIARGEADGRTSTAVLEEVWHVERSGAAGELDGLTERLYTLFTPLLGVTDEAFRHALAVEEPDLGTNDRLNVGTCRAHAIAVVLTADRGFNRLEDPRRVDPLDARARRRLLRPATRRRDATSGPQP